MDIEALVDNELDPQTAARVHYAVAHDPQLQRRYSKLLSQKKLLNLWWQRRQQH